jgi:hypothetical protein
MAKRLLDYDAFTGLITWHDYDEATETTYLHYQQDVEPLLDACKHDVNHADRKLGDGVHVASIPASVQIKWLVDHGVDALSQDPGQKRAVARLLDGEYKHLKRLPIRIGGY